MLEVSFLSWLAQHYAALKGGCRRQAYNPTNFTSRPQVPQQGCIFFHSRPQLDNICNLHSSSTTAQRSSSAPRHPSSQSNHYRTAQDRRVYDDYRKPQNYRLVIPCSAPFATSLTFHSFIETSWSDDNTHRMFFPFSSTILPSVRSWSTSC